MRKAWNSNEVLFYGEKVGLYKVRTGDYSMIIVEELEILEGVKKG